MNLAKSLLPIIVLLAGCAGDAALRPATGGWHAVIARQEAQEACANLFRSRLDRALAGADLSGDRDALLAAILARLPAEELAALTEAATTTGRLSLATPDTAAIPEVMSKLDAAFDAADICRRGGTPSDAWVFADVLGASLIANGLDVDLLFPANDDWRGPQVQARLMVALVMAIQGDANSERTFLPRIVAIDGQRSYPDGLALDTIPPKNMEIAVQRLFQALPRSPAISGDRGACTFQSTEGVDLGLSTCLSLACQGLARSSRDKGCGYLVRLSEWVEVNWLGGLCRLPPDRRESDLVEWFERRGIAQCHVMSTAIAIALAQALVGHRQAPEAILRALKTESPGQD